MTSIDLRFTRTITQMATIIVEVPDDMSGEEAEEAAEKLTAEQINRKAQDRWNEEEPTIDSPPTLTGSEPKDDDSKGRPDYRLGESGEFEDA